MQHDVRSHQIEVEYHADIRCIRVMGVRSIHIHRRVVSAEMAPVLGRNKPHRQRTPTDSVGAALWGRRKIYSEMPLR